MNSSELREIRELAKSAVARIYSGDKEMLARYVESVKKEFHESVTPQVVIALFDYAKNRSDMLDELVAATDEIISISDRDHEAWNAAKDVIQKYKREVFDG